MSKDAFEHLSPQRLLSFTSGMVGLSPEEMRKAKRLYLLDALTTYEGMLNSLAAFAIIQLLFACIPLFWPILLVQWLSMRAGRNTAKGKIMNALEVWKDDLGDDYDSLRDRLEKAPNQTWLLLIPVVALTLLLGVACAGYFGVVKPALEDLEKQQMEEQKRREEERRKWP